MTWFTSSKGALLNVDSIAPVNKIDDHIYIGSQLSGRVIKLKAFVKDYKLNITKNLDEQTDPLMNSRVYIATSGDFSWNLSLDVPSATIEESKRNLAKISELQKMIAINSTQTDWKGIATQASCLLIHYKNLICQSEIDEYRETEPSNFTDLLKKGVICWVDEVKYTPDLTIGSFSDSDGVFAKNFTLNLTINLSNIGS